MGIGRFFGGEGDCRLGRLGQSLSFTSAKVPCRRSGSIRLVVTQLHSGNNRCEREGTCGNPEHYHYCSFASVSWLLTVLTGHGIQRIHCGSLHYRCGSLQYRYSVNVSQISRFRENAQAEAQDGQSRRTTPSCGSLLPRVKKELVHTPTRVSKATRV